MAKSKTDSVGTLPPHVSGRGFVTILEWMVDELDLSGNTLLIYAIIYGFSQGDRQEFTGTNEYLARWTGLTARNVIRNTKKLLEMGLIEKGKREFRGQKVPTYRAVLPKEFGVTKCHTPVTKCHTDQCQNVIPHMTKCHPDNIEYNINNIYTPPCIPPRGETPHENAGGDESEKPKRNHPFIPPSVEEVRAYCLERNNGVDADRFVDYYTSNGWMVGRAKMKDWRAAVRTWERDRKQDPVSRVQDGVKSSFDTDEFFEAALRRSLETYGNKKGE